MLGAYPIAFGPSTGNAITGAPFQSRLSPSRHEESDSPKTQTSTPLSFKATESSSITFFTPAPERVRPDVTIAILISSLFY